MYEIFILLALKCVDSKLTGFVLGGDYTNINAYPHSVYLDIQSEHMWLCGGSILNQHIVLTAAHCFDEYRGRVVEKVIIKYGATAIAAMYNTIMLHYRVHERYNEYSMSCDISLIRSTTPIRLGRSVKRVAIMKTPPRVKLAYVSGWGSINREQELPQKIKYTKQEIQASGVCGKYLSLPDGTFCAGPITGAGHPAVGDSGSALVVQKYIQIGIVSFKEENYSLVVYTNVSYYYDWIRQNAAFTYCARAG